MKKTQKTHPGPKGQEKKRKGGIKNRKGRSKTLWQVRLTHQLQQWKVEFPLGEKKSTLA